MRILLLAGTTEAREIAEGLAAEGRPALASLAGAVRQPRPLPLPTRVGGFGGAEGFRRVVAEEDIGAVIDATHPYAQRITERTVRICAELTLPCLQVRRLPWQPGPGDDWREIADETEVASHVPQGATVFLATGGGRLARYGGLPGRRVIVRRIDDPRARPSGFEVVQGRPPHSEESELALFRELGVDWLVCRNSGGESGRSKLAAARSLGLPVLMLRRPEAPAGPRAGTASEALGWARAL